MCIGEKRFTQCVKCDDKMFEKYVWLGCASGKQVEPADWSSTTASCSSTVLDTVHKISCSACIIAQRELLLSVPDPANNPRPVQPHHPADTARIHPPLLNYDWSQKIDQYEIGREMVARPRVIVDTSTASPSRNDYVSPPTRRPGMVRTASDAVPITSSSALSRLGAPIRRTMSRRRNNAVSQPSSPTIPTHIYPQSFGQHTTINPTRRLGATPQPRMIGTHPNPLRSNPVTPDPSQITNIEVIPDGSSPLPTYPQSQASEQPPPFLLAEAAGTYKPWTTTMLASRWQHSLHTYHRTFRPTFDALVSRANKIRSTPLPIKLLVIVADELTRIRAEANTIADRAFNVEEENWETVMKYATSAGRLPDNPSTQSFVAKTGEMELLYGKLKTDADYDVAFLAHRMNVWLGYVDGVIAELEQIR